VLELAGKRAPTRIEGWRAVPIEVAQDLKAKLVDAGLMARPASRRSYASHPTMPWLCRSPAPAGRFSARQIVRVGSRLDDASLAAEAALPLSHVCRPAERRSACGSECSPTAGGSDGHVLLHSRVQRQCLGRDACAAWVALANRDSGWFGSLRPADDFEGGCRPSDGSVTWRRREPRALPRRSA